MKEYQDWFFKKAKKEGVFSRAFFKLQEMDRKYHLLSPGKTILDLGCAPGSWLQYAVEHVGKTGRVVGVDKAEPKGSFPAWVRLLRKDLFQLEPKDLLDADGKKFDVVLSDAAPNTTGERFVDQCNSLAIAQRVLQIAMEVLKPGGHLVIKIFQGGESNKLLEECRTHFDAVRVEKPQSSRKESFEVYWVALSRKEN